MSKANSPTAARMVTASERERQAVTLRMAGTTFAEIAKQLNYKGRQGAYAAVTRALAENEEVVAHERSLALMRLDRMLRGIWPKATTGDLLAIDRVLKLSEERAKLLGLYKPIKVDIRAQLIMEAERLDLDVDDVLLAAEEIIAEGV